jgi:acyl-CoA synthetase (AMP-forming)/AMP-acid ligase II
MSRSSGLAFKDVVEALRFRAHESPDEVAFVWLEDGESCALELTYAELDRRAARIAYQLRRRVAPGERALLLFPPGIDFVSAFFGCLYARVVAVPAYPPDPYRYKVSIARLLSISEQARCSVVITDKASVRARIDAEVSGLRGVHWLCLDEAEFQSERGAGALVDDSVSGDTTAFLQYTSGSTAAPKGVVLAHRNIVDNQRLIHAALGVNASSVVVNWLPLYHDMGLIGGVMTAVCLGSRNVLLSPLHVLQRPVRWLRAIDRYRGTHSGGPNFGYQLCAQKLTEADKAGLDLSSWICAYNGSEPIRQATLSAFSQALAGQGFRSCHFHNCYGLAESTLFVTGTTCEPRVQSVARTAYQAGRFEPGDRLSPELVTIVGVGRARGDTRIEIVDPATCLRCPPGEVGEIWVRGSSVASGYWGLPEATQETFEGYLEPERIGPFLRTGDNGVLLDGELFVCGRIKDVIISAGRKIHAEDVETTVRTVSDGLRLGAIAAFEVGLEGSVVIVAGADARRVQSEPELPLRIGAAVTEIHQLRVHEVALIRPSDFPKTSSGKVQRRLCRSRYERGEFDPIARWQPTRATQQVAPTPVA